MKPYVIVFYLPDSGRPVAAQVTARDEDHARELFINGNAEMATLKVKIYQMTAKEWMKKNGHTAISAGEK